jgi:hypothetical protein
MTIEDRLKFVEALLDQIIKSDRYVFSRTLQMQDGRNIQLGRSNGTKIGLSASEKLGFLGATPRLQWTPVGNPAFSVGFGAAITDLSKWPSGAGGSKYTIGDVVEALIAFGILAA